MKIEHIDGRLCVALVGMPRSGSTIISSFVNSIDGAFIIGEPHAMVRAPRPPRMGHVPTIIESEYGVFKLLQGHDVLSQIEQISAGYGLQIYGFKECEIQRLTNMPRLVRSYGERIDITLLTIRDPRRSYMSMLQLTDPRHGLPDAIHFNDSFVEIAELADDASVAVVLYEQFRLSPKRSIERATGWSISGEVELKQYIGGGDPTAIGSKKIRARDNRAPYGGTELNEAERAYNKLVRDIGP